MPFKTSMCLSAVTMLLIAAAGAAADAETGLYVGATAGGSFFHENKSRLDAAVVDAWNAIDARVAPPSLSAAVNSSSLDKSHFAFGGLVGYRLTPQFSIEAAYIDLGQLRYKSNDTVTYHTSPGGFPVPASANTTAKAQGPTLTALGILPLSPAWEIYGRAGVFFSKVTLDTQVGLNLSVMQASGFGIAGTWNTVIGNSIDPLLGVGVAWHLPAHVTLRGEYTRFINVGDRDKTGEINIDLFNVGVTYSFR